MNVYNMFWPQDPIIVQKWGIAFYIQKPDWWNKLQESDTKLYKWLTVFYYNSFKL